MTRKETQDRLQKVTHEIQELEGRYLDHALSWQLFKRIHEADLLETALKFDKDPDTVWFAYEIRTGRGVPFKK